MYPAALPSRPKRRRRLVLLAVSIFFIILVASAAGLVASKHFTGQRSVSPVNTETSPTIPLSAGLSTTPPTP